MILMQDIQMNIQDESDKLQIEINEDKETLTLGLDEKFVEGTSDYNKLKNKPKLNGNEIIGEVEEIDPNVGESRNKTGIYTGRYWSYGRRFCNICINNRTR